MVKNNSAGMSGDDSYDRWLTRYLKAKSSSTISERNIVRSWSIKKMYITGILLYFYYYIVLP